MCKAWCIINAQLMCHYCSGHFNGQGSLEDSLSPLKVGHHFTLPRISEKGADKEDAECSALVNDQRQQQ